VPVTVPEPAEYVALGAARQAAWALSAAAGSGAAGPPSWPLPGAGAEYTAEPAPEVRERYGRLRDDTLGWTA
jgi:xylulokinase